MRWAIGGVAAWMLLLAGCGKPLFNVGKVIEGVSPDSVAMELILIGDAGLPAPGGEPVLKALREATAWDPRRSFVVYLGDNIYPSGLPDSAGATRREGERILKAQIDAVADGEARGVFVPGNHDWEAGEAGGWWSVARQGDYINAHGDGKVGMLPVYGCPGPAVIDFGEHVRLVLLDTQWWLHRYGKPYGRSPTCGNATPEAVVDSIKSVLASAGTRHTVVAAHHPLVSGGQHGGYFDWPTYLFPFHPWARKAGVFADQDITGAGYRRMSAALTRAFSDHPPLAYAAGHEHNLQVLRRDPARYLIVSGGGIYGHTTPVRAITGVQYARRASGYVRLTFLQDRRVRLAVMVVDGQGKASEDFSMWLTGLVPAKPPEGAAP